MTRTHNQAASSQRPGLPRWMVKLVLLAVAVVAILVLRVVIGLGAAYMHYRSTQDFNAFVTERAVPQEEIEAWLPEGVTLAQGEAWTLGETREESVENLGVLVELRITHGDEVLLATTVEVLAEVDTETWDRVGLRIPIPGIEARDGMHAVVQVGLVNVESMLASSETAGGRVIVDAVLAAGPGENVFRIVELDETPESLEGLEPTLPLLKALFGLVHPSGELPDEGILHQTRASVDLTWRKLIGGTQNAGLGPSSTRTNCHEYSYETRISLVEHHNGRQSLSRSQSWIERFTWNDEVW